MISMYSNALTINGDNLRPFFKGNSGKVRETYYSPERNNLIVFKPCDKGIDTNSIINCTMEQPFNYLMNALDHERNIVVVWSQVEGTTSDFQIHYGQNVQEMDIKNHRACLKLLGTPSTIRYKYTMIKNAVAYQITLNKIPVGGNN
ncbi:hypothetical protein [Paenibacillus sp. Soil787]|uniref:hypothetical protein n=1 Tax=Paenibacillus sp. Soil787 TaxID=1736411 RepID=UPI0006F66E7F|nr:hypothetical protein [Paenibacillus sp. Soil787]KRF31947.1 hypothetical protein ASG93_06400 [Paenibacillus sp. Soil787]